MRAFLPLAIAFLSIGCTAQPAAPAAAATPAGTILASSSPAAGSTSTEPVYSLRLRFNPRAQLDELLVDGPTGTTASMVTAVGESDTYVVPIDAPGPGAYTVRWRAHSGGTEHRGQFGFTVR